MPGPTIFADNPESLEFIAFIKNIDWTEKWLLGLVALHILITMLTITTRHHHTLQGFLFVCLLMIVCSSEMLNELGAKHWKRFSKQQYFDSGGLFISVIVSMPILFNCLMMVINWLWLSSRMIVTLKKLELEKQLASRNAKKDQ